MLHAHGSLGDGYGAYAHSGQVQAVFKARVWGALKQMVIVDHGATRWREVMMAAINNDDNVTGVGDTMPVRNLIEECAFLSGKSLVDVLDRLGETLMGGILNELDPMLLARLKVDKERDIAGILSRSELGFTEVALLEQAGPSFTSAVRITAVPLTDDDRAMHAAMFRVLGDHLGLRLTVEHERGLERGTDRDRFMVVW